MGIAISVTEFKAKCLKLIDQLERHEIDSIELTKHGRPVAVVNAKEAAKPTTVEEVLAGFAASQARMAGMIKILDPNFDWTEPVVDPDEIEAYKGRFFPDDE